MELVIVKQNGIWRVVLIQTGAVAIFILLPAEFSKGMHL